MSEKQDPVQAISRNEAAHRLGVHRATVSRAIERGELHAVRFGRRVLIPVSEIERILASRAGQ